MECPVTADTANALSTVPISTVPASSGKVRVARARLRRFRRVEPRNVAGEKAGMNDMTCDDHGEDTPQASPSRCAIHHGCHAQGGSSCIGTIPVASQHHTLLVRVV